MTLPWPMLILIVCLLATVFVLAAVAVNRAHRRGSEVD